MIYHTFSENTLRNFSRSIFIKMGCPIEHADLATDVLIKSDLRGIDSFWMGICPKLEPFWNSWISYLNGG